jgi:hypothetical protein
MMMMGDDGDDEHEIETSVMVDDITYDDDDGEDDGDGDDIYTSVMVDDITYDDDERDIDTYLSSLGT